VTVNPLQVSANTGWEMGDTDTRYAMWIEGRRFYPFIASLGFIGVGFSIAPYTILSHLLSDTYILNWNKIIFQ